MAGTADLAILNPTEADPVSVPADQADQAVLASVRATIAGAPAPGLGRSSFSARIGATDATVTAVVAVGDRYLLLLDPASPLPAGTYPLEITFGGVTTQEPGAVVVASGGTAAAAATPSVRAMLVLEDEGQAGTPIRAAVVVSEPGRAIAGATVTASVTDPTGRVRAFPLVDDGASGDSGEGDGVYGADLWATDAAGPYAITVTATGLDSSGAPFSVDGSDGVSLAAKVDADADGVADIVEPRFGLEPGVPDGATDHDGDGLGLAEELRRGTDPWAWDTDRGGENDASEVAAGRDPLEAGDDGEVRSVLLSARSIDGRRIVLRGSTNDGAGSLRLYRLDGASLVTLGTFPGSGVDLVDGPLPAGTYEYAAVAIGPSGAESAPAVVGPRRAIDDATLPGARLVVESGRWETNDREVAVAFLDVSEPLAEMRLAESLDDLAAAPWVPFQESSTFTLGPEPGAHSVYAQVRDASGLASLVMLESIDLDPVAPASSAAPLPAFTAAPTIAVEFTTADAGSFVANVELWVRFRPSAADAWGAWSLESSAAASPIAYAFAYGEGEYEFYTIAADGAGNREPAPPVADARTTFDQTPPVTSAGPVDPTSTGTSTPVPFTASDAVSGVASVELWWRYRATDADPWGTWTLGPTGSSSPITFTVASGDGLYEFYTIGIDAAGERVGGDPDRNDTIILSGSGLAVDDRSVVTVQWQLYGVRVDGSTRRLNALKSAYAQDGAFDSRSEGFGITDFRFDAGYVAYDVYLEVSAGSAVTTRTVRVEVGVVSSARP